MQKSNQDLLHNQGLCDDYSFYFSSQQLLDDAPQKSGIKQELVSSNQNSNADDQQLLDDAQKSGIKYELVSTKKILCTTPGIQHKNEELPVVKKLKVFKKQNDTKINTIKKNAIYKKQKNYHNPSNNHMARSVIRAYIYFITKIDRKTNFMNFLDSKGLNCNKFSMKLIQIFLEYEQSIPELDIANYSFNNFLKNANFDDILHDNNNIKEEKYELYRIFARQQIDKYNRQANPVNRKNSKNQIN